MNLDKNKVVVGMSGGVDSSVAAYLLKEAGYDVIGINMRLWSDPEMEHIAMMKDGGCCSLSSAEDARRVCQSIGIPFYALDFKKVFKETVVDYFVDSYSKGETPNPCIACNKYVKFDALLEKANELGAYYVATGHYAKIKEAEDGKFYVEQSDASGKDQTYAIYNLTQDQLSHILMPLGEFDSKEEVRKIADKIDGIVAKKADSQEICFIPDDDYQGFLKRMGLETQKGDMFTVDGKLVGKHEGIEKYTIGQRKGLGYTFGKPHYVVDIDPNLSRVIVGDGDSVYSQHCLARDINFIDDREKTQSITDPDIIFRATAKIRYSAKLAPCKVTIGYFGGAAQRLRVDFDEKQRAITPGQAVAIYSEDGRILLGGGTIIRDY